jgi:two-component system, NtrC family, sensor histidine kinase HydH
MESVKIQGADSQSLRANKLMLLERLADDLAHEIKNPLHSMVINLEVLKRRVSRWSGADATELMRYVAILAGELDRVSRRIDLLLRMVRPERGGEPASLATVVEELLEVVDLERERMGISVELRPPALPPRLRLHRDSARQIVLNLLLLALDAAQPAGTVIITPIVEPDEESLRIVSIPVIGGHRTVSAGVMEDRAMQLTARSLAESRGGRMEVGSPAEGPEHAAEFILGIPVGAA